uniref:Evolutionarily conserved signaling intermediate in Toll pathway, mitochondrial n=1 Tax=Chrysemys picta bellii TaxID=8478 RepID=A0A8C3IIZ4_CHRPI|nr:evolutionarily conserved signaling intermediate in Toll pathway, mitochondrial [Chrysemys picta bellii]
MNCVRKLLLAREFSAGRGVLRQAAPGRDLPWLQGSSCGQRFWLVPVRSIRSGAALSRFELVPSARGDKEKDRGPRDGSLVPLDELFELAHEGDRNKAAFSRALELFCQRDVRRRGHVEFINIALRKMPEFGVERELDVYNKILDVFPKEVFVPRNYIQRMFNHYPRQQECGIRVLEQMESYGITPNKQTKFLLLQIFGEKSHPVRKYRRLMYWFPKFKHVNPYPVPAALPRDPVDLARISLQRIAADLSAKVTVYQMPLVDISDAGKEITQPHIVGIQSPDQQEILAHHNPSRPVFVEGPFPLWLKKTCVYYYVLRGELLPPEEKEEVIDSERNFFYPMHLDLDLDRGPWDDEEFDVDEAVEGPIFAMCMAGAGDQATLAKWILGLQQTNPILSQTPVVFHLTPGPRELQAGSDSASGEEEIPQSWHAKQEL